MYTERSVVLFTGIFSLQQCLHWNLPTFTWYVEFQGVRRKPEERLAKNGTEYGSPSVSCSLNNDNFFSHLSPVLHPWARLNLVFSMN